MRLKDLLVLYEKDRPANHESFTRFTSATDINDFLEWYLDNDFDNKTDFETTQTDIVKDLLEMEKK